MPETFLTTSAIYSAVFGALFGLIIGPIMRRPQTWLGFAILVVINALIPYASATVILARIHNPFIIHFSLFLFAVLAAMNLMFLIRQLVRRLLRTAPDTAGEPA